MFDAGGRLFEGSLYRPDIKRPDVLAFFLGMQLKVD